MDNTEKLNQYRRILEQVIEKHAAMPGEPETVESIPVCDSVHDNYLLMDVGWYLAERAERAHYVIVHLRIKDGKVRIEQDGIEYGIAEDLIEAGIPKEDIVLAFSDQEPRTLTELAAA